jgi:thiol-disulfide isomerase/thioredoxin
MIKSIVKVKNTWGLLLFLLGTWGFPLPALQETTAPSSKDFQGIVTILEFGYMSCTHCKKMEILLNQIKKEYHPQIKLINYDFFAERDLPYVKKFNIRTIPTQIFLDGKENVFFRNTGLLSKENCRNSGDQRSKKIEHQSIKIGKQRRNK